MWRFKGHPLRSVPGRWRRGVGGRTPVRGLSTSPSGDPWSGIRGPTSPNGAALSWSSVDRSLEVERGDRGPRLSPRFVCVFGSLSTHLSPGPLLGPFRVPMSHRSDGGYPGGQGSGVSRTQKTRTSCSKCNTPTRELGLTLKTSSERSSYD